MIDANGWMGHCTEVRQHPLRLVAGDLYRVRGSKVFLTLVGVATVVRTEQEVVVFSNGSCLYCCTLGEWQQVAEEMVPDVPAKMAGTKPTGSGV